MNDRTILRRERNGSRQSIHACLREESAREQSHTKVSKSFRTGFSPRKVFCELFLKDLFVFGLFFESANIYILLLLVFCVNYFLDKNYKDDKLRALPNLN